MDIDLCLSGGSVKGLYELTGVLQAVKDSKCNVIRFSGNSAGGVVACLYGSGLEPEAIWERLSKEDPRSFISDSWWAKARLLLCGALSNGTKYHDLLREMMGEKTFADSRVELKIMGTNITKHRLVVFTREEYSGMLLCDAARITSSLPAGFDNFLYQEQMFTDGGLYRHFPINAWKDFPRLRLGFLLGHDPHDDRIFVPQGKGVLQTLDVLMSAFVDDNVHDAVESVEEAIHEGQAIVLSDSPPFGTFQFKFSLEERRGLYDRGYAKTRAALEHALAS